MSKYKHLFNILVVLILVIGLIACSQKENDELITKEHFLSDIKSRGKIVNGEQEGIWVHYNENNGKLIKVNYYKEGKKYGYQYAFHDKGHLYNVAFYKNDTTISKFMNWYSNGILNFIEYYTNYGTLSDSTKVWYKTGQLKQKGFYNNGKRDSIWSEFYK